MVELLDAVFGGFRADQELCNALCAAAKLPCRGHLREVSERCTGPDSQPEAGTAPRPRALDLASLRTGGATFLQQLFEDASFTQGRGRWVDRATMEMYFQEVSAIAFSRFLTAEAQELVRHLCSLAPVVHKHAVAWVRADYPRQKWYDRFAAVL